MGANVINFPKPRPSGDCESRAKHTAKRGDACGNQNQRNPVMEILVEEAGKLPLLRGGGSPS